MIERYSRRILFSGKGEEGQKKLGSSSVLIIGCGALGTIIASSLVRAGVGRIKIVDRDFIEYHNMQRQVPFDEDDIEKGLPKAVAAERRLKKINSSVDVEGIVTDVNFANVERLITGTDLILDGLDNLETRFLINDASLKYKVPWVYGGASSSYGMTMNIIPGQSPCFKCFYTSSPGNGIIPTCDTAGVISPALFIIGSLEAVEAMKILVGAEKEINRNLILIDVWTESFERFDIVPLLWGKFA